MTEPARRRSNAFVAAGHSLQGLFGSHHRSSRSSPASRESLGVIDLRPKWEFLNVEGEWQRFKEEDEQQVERDYASGKKTSQYDGKDRCATVSHR